FSLMTSLSRPTALPGAGLANTAFSSEDGAGSAVVTIGAATPMTTTQRTSVRIALLAIPWPADLRLSGEISSEIELNFTLDVAARLALERGTPTPPRDTTPER